MDTIGFHIAAIRNPLKLDTADIRLTDRDIYAYMVPGRDMLVKRTDTKMKLMTKDSLFKPVCIQLQEVNVVECCLECYQVKSDCKVQRSKEKLPKIIEGDEGAIIFYVSSLDGSQDMMKTTKESYAKKIKKATYKYDTTLYFWLENGYAYFPNIEWEAVLMSAYFEDSLKDCKDKKNRDCANMQDMEFKIPDYLVEDLYTLIWNKFTINKQIRSDAVANKNDQG